ncbi:hypothetical protein ACSMXM_00520 [Pacificimonas sp. ICDLI1SI03]
MNRVRVGLTGLALVFLMALLFAALIGPVGFVDPRESPNDTLATIGVVPGGEDKDQDKEGEPEFVPPPPIVADPLTPPGSREFPLIPEDPNAEPLPKLSTDGEVTEI